MRKALSSDTFCPHVSAFASASGNVNTYKQSNSSMSVKSYNSTSTQTQEDLNSNHVILNQQIIANVNTEETRAILIILVKIKELTVPYLIDISSSISVINSNHFKNVKHMLHPKYLS